VTAKISNNHMHSLVISMADISAGVKKCYNSRGGSTHDHFVTITEADFATLKAGGVVRKESCDGTDHEYTLSCGTAPNASTPKCSDPTLGEKC
jgi:hypothetical protein